MFVVNPGELSRAVGRGGYNVRNLEKALNRKIKIVEFNPGVSGFIRGLIFPLRADEISEEGGIVIMQSPDTKTRGLLIGRGAQNLRRFETIAQRYFKIKQIKVI